MRLSSCDGLTAGVALTIALNRPPLDCLVNAQAAFIVTIMAIGEKMTNCSVAKADRLEPRLGIKLILGRTGTHHRDRFGIGHVRVLRSSRSFFDGPVECRRPRSWERKRTKLTWGSRGDFGEWVN